jgi:phosphate transport system substrate-binding protein
MVFGAVLAAAIVALACGCTGATGGRSTLDGAGSSFVAPLVARWTPALRKAFGYHVEYSAVGSGGGIRAVVTRQVDFGASDAPLTASQLRQCRGCVQIPWALSATAIVYDLPGAPGGLRIDGPTLAKIFSGRITRWDDPALRRLNPGVRLPAARITPVHRSDDSGTTFDVTGYLSGVSASWRARYGHGVAVPWPTGTSGKGSAGLTAQVLQTPGSIGYVEVAYALRSRLKYFAVENEAGRFVLPTVRSTLAGARSAARGYPLAGFTYVIVPLRDSKAAALKQAIRWVLTAGQRYGRTLDFAPLPAGVRAAGIRELARVHAS